jgi:peptide/nickel transport system permease protein
MVSLKGTTNIVNKLEYKKQSHFGEIWKRMCRNKLAVAGLVVLVMVSLCSIFANVIAPYGIDDQNLANRFIAPCKEFPFGTDSYGRDIFSRVLYGGRVSLSVGFVSAGLSSIIGVILGLLAGYYEGTANNVIMRIMDVFLSIPTILLAIAIAASLGPGIMNAMIAVSIANIPKMTRVTRAAVLSQRHMEYIEAAQSIRASNIRIMMRHILPNSLSPIIVQVTFYVATGILTAASLSFLGLGAQAPNPEWGAMLSSGRDFLRDYPWLCTYPGIAIFVTVLSLNFVGDGLRDALDPKLKN